MKVAHVKTVDGTTVMIQLSEDDEQRFLHFINTDSEHWTWMEHNEVCLIFRKNIISIRFRDGDF